MKRARPSIVAACVVVLAAGCQTALTGAYWLPDFTSDQRSGTGGSVLDLSGDLGLQTDDSVLVYEVVGEEAGQRLRLDYWKISGGGAKQAPRDYDFANTNYTAGDSTESSLDLLSIGVLYEPALIKTANFRFRLVLGLELMQLDMTVDNLTTGQTGKLAAPGTDTPFAEMGLDYVPVPLIGAAVEAGIKPPWLSLVLRGQGLQIEDFEGVDANFLTGEAGLLFGKPSRGGFNIFIGYRYFHAEYTYQDDDGATTLKGPSASFTLRF
jgi:hypothetical protein